MTGASGSLGLPVSPTFLVGLKVSGFWLHMIFMNLWLTGIPVALFVQNRRPRVSQRIFKAMPFFMAFGINAGIVPLLFIQVLVPEAFYTATILQAWFWFLIIPLLLVAYYAVYLASSGWYRTASAWVAFVLLTSIGLTFSSSLSLSALPEHWQQAFEHTTTTGAVTGTYFLIAPEVLFRFGIVVSLALITLAAYLALDARWFHVNRTYRNQTQGLIAPLTMLGVLGFLACGWGYRHYLPVELSPFGTMSVAGGTPVVAGITGLVHAWKPSRRTAALFAGVQSVALLANAIVRQHVQIAKLGGWAQLQALPVRGEWSTVVLFLITLMVGVAVIAWIVTVLGSTRPGALD